MALTIRPHQASDLPALVAIYNHYVATSPVTFDLESFEPEQRRPWFETYAQDGPHRLLVAEQDGQPVGYASSGPFRAKPAYGRSVETTIYLAPEAAGRGLGRQLYGALLEILREEPEVHRAVGGVTLPNPASVALHERLGFVDVGTFLEIGFKFGRYWDVRWFERDLSS